MGEKKNRKNWQKLAGMMVKISRRLREFIWQFLCEFLVVGRRWEDKKKICKICKNENL